MCHHIPMGNMIILLSYYIESFKSCFRTDKSKGGKKGIGRGKRNYSPVSWKDYFNRREEVIVGKSVSLLND